MDRYEFLRLVLPQEGNGNYVATFGKVGQDGKKRFWNNAYQTINELADACAYASGRGLTAYYALGTFLDNVSENDAGKIVTQRTSAKANVFKTLAIDVDCGEGKPYATQEEGMKALVEFVKASKVPVPTVISSGNGVHAYWPLNVAVPKAIWVNMSKVLKAICNDFRLHIDESKVHEPSMVLRPLDTTNFKGNHTVRPILVKSEYDAVKLGRRLLELKPQAKAVAKPMTMTYKSAIAEAVVAGAKQDHPPLIAEQIVERCLQMQRITANNGATASEPEWYLACGMAGYTERPEETVVQWSSGHKDFDADESISKMQQWVSKTDGPPTCSRFDSVTPGRCSQCALFGKIGSPAKLGHPLPKPVEMEDDTPTPAVEPPAPFIRTAEGVAMNLQTDLPVTICAYDLFPSHIAFDPTVGYEEVEFVWKKPHVGYSRIRVRTAHIFSDGNLGDLISHLANHGLYVATKQNQVAIGAYMRAYVQKLQAYQSTAELHSSFGWKDDGKRFVLGSVEISKGPDGRVGMREVGVAKSSTEKQLDSAFEPKGDIKEWIAMTEHFNRQGLELHQVVLGAAFAAPLVALTGLNGFSLSILGQGGEGKSTIQNWMTSVYGNPRRLMMKKEDTKLSYVQRFGTLANLPVAIDECTLMEPNTLADILYWATQGQDKNRATESVANTWALPVVMSTNKSLRDKLVAVSSDTEAISMRLLEFRFKQNEVFDDLHDTGRRMGTLVMNNYGHVGRHYIKHLVNVGTDALRFRIEQHGRDLERKYNVRFSGKERYWALAITLISLGLELAKEAKLIRFDHSKGVAAAIEEITGQREQVAEVSTTDVYDMLADYITNHANMMVVVAQRNDAWSTLQLPNGEVRLRQEIYQNKAGKIEAGFMHIDRHHLQRWLVVRKYDYRKVLDQLQADGYYFEPNNYKKVYLTKHTSVRMPQVPSFSFTLDNPKFAGMLDKFAGTEDNRPARFVDLNAVKKA